MACVTVSDFERKAETILEKSSMDYYNCGSGEEFTLSLNCEAFKKLRIRPRCLRDVSSLDTSCNIFGSDLKWPVGISPSAMQKLAHPVGETGNVLAAGKMGSIFILSTLSTTSIEDLATAAPDTCKWFQLYIYKERELTVQLLRRVENAGFKAVVLTIDAPVFGRKQVDLRNGFQLPSNLSLANFEGIQAKGVQGAADNSSISQYVASQFDKTLTWNDVTWLRKNTKLPVVVKGVLTREDAILAREFGCAGIIVSNHGGRQLDHAPASIEALPEIAEAVGNDLVVMMDGGVRTGSDVFKALARGAKYVFVGRPAVWGLVCNGQQGVEDLMEVLKKEFEITLALAGCTRLRDISKEMVVHESYYAKI